MNDLSLVIYGYEISKGYGDPSKKVMEIPGDGGSNVKPPGTENPGDWGSNWEWTLRGGYGYSLEPHIKCSKCFTVYGLIQKGNRRELVYLSSILLINIIFAY